MSDKLILHGMQSPNVIKVILMLEECGLDYELRHTAVFNQAQFEPEFLKLNPLGKVPVLEDPKLGIPLAESGAILFWLAEREGRFLPTSQPQLAGGEYSIADMATQPWAYYVERHGFDPALYPALVEWRTRIAARPAVQRALARATEAFDSVANRTRKAASDEDLDRFFGRTDTVQPTDYSAVKLM